MIEISRVSAKQVRVNNICLSNNKFKPNKGEEKDTPLAVQQHRHEICFECSVFEQAQYTYGYPPGISKRQYFKRTHTETYMSIQM